jgi:hypothetical protein
MDFTFAAVAPTLQHFYAGLDDEQKARLVRNMALAEAQFQVEREPEQWPSRSA